jgi:hypothetical protein
MAEFIDPFETEAPVEASGFVDPFESGFTEPKEAPKSDNSFTSVLKDVGRLFVSPATVGLNALGYAAGQGLAGGDVTKAAIEGAQSDDFLGLKLSMDSSAGKAVEEWLGEKLTKVREASGELAVDALKNKGVRAALKAFPLPALALDAYDVAPEEVKTKIEALTYAGASAAPEIALTLLGGSKANKALSKKASDLTEADILATIEEPVKPDDTGTVDFTKETIPTDEVTQETVIPDNALEFEKVTPESLRTTQGELDFTDPVEGIPFEKVEPSPEIKEPPMEVEGLAAQFDLPGINVPMGQTNFGKGQRGSVNLFKPKEYTPEQKAKKLNVEEFTQDFIQRHPQYADRPEVAAQVYQRLNNPVENSFSIKDAINNSETLKSLDRGVGIVSTRVGNISQPVLHRLLRFEKNLLQNTHTKIGAVDDFINDLNKLPKNTQALMNNLLLNNNTEGIARIAKQINRPDLIKKHSVVRSVLDDVGNDLKSIGRIEELRKDYFPRIVTDVEGLKATLGSSMRSALEVRLDDARRNAAKKGQAFGALEESQMIDSFLRGNTSLKGKPGFAKERKIDDVSPDLEKFYASPTESLHTYLRNAVAEVETARLFGKDAVRDKAGRVDVEQSIGTLVQDKLRSGEITGKQAIELESMMKSRLGPGNQASNAVLQDVKNIANMGLLGNVISSITQGGDIISSTYLNGFRPTMMALVAQAAGKTKVNMKDFGLIDHISEEFVSKRSSAKALNKIFDLSFFSAMDRLGKNTVLNGALINGQRMVKTPSGRKAFADRWQKRFGDEFPQLVNDLQNGRKTELTDMYTFSTLSKIQPITKLELPQKYLDMPNGRVIYMLKTFMLKQLDLYRNDGYNKIKEGKTREGLTNIAKLTMVLGIGGATTQYIKDFILLGSEGVDPELSDIPMNVLKTFGWSQYVTDKVKRGALGEALGDIILPPYKMFDTMFKESIQELDGDDETVSKGKSIKYLPLIGKILYNYGYGGKDDELDKRSKVEEE